MDDWRPKSGTRAFLLLSEYVLFKSDQCGYSGFLAYAVALVSLQEQVGHRLIASLLKAKSMAPHKLSSSLRDSLIEIRTPSMRFSWKLIPRRTTAAGLSAPNVAIQAFCMTAPANLPLEE